MNVKNSAAVLEIQIDQHDPKLRVSLMVLDNALQPLFYNDLRRVSSWVTSLIQV